ncbi:hypothetical protein PTKIN_Ptkin03bG0129000 [Pterospermum kingtungense]
MATPATIPLTNSPSTAAGGAQSPPIATPAFRVFISRLTSSIHQGLSQRRPCQLHNSTCCCTRFLSPFSLLLLLGLLAAWVFLCLFRPSDQPLVILGRTFSHRETLGALVVLTVFVVFLTSVGSLLISALLIGVAIICIHGAFRVPEDLFLDEQEPANSGFLSFLGGAASSAAAAAAPAVASRV